MAEANQFKSYIGDSVYADWDGLHIVLTTEDGSQTTNTIYLEAEVIAAFEEYLTQLKRTLKALAAGADHE